MLDYFVRSLVWNLFSFFFLLPKVMQLQIIRKHFNSKPPRCVMILWLQANSPPNNPVNRRHQPHTTALRKFRKAEPSQSQRFPLLRVPHVQQPARVQNHQLPVLSRKGHRLVRTLGRVPWLQNVQLISALCWIRRLDLEIL